MKELVNKKIYIAPYTPISKAFATYISKNHNITLQGFIDKNKTGDKIYKINTIAQEYDYITIISPNHADNIYQDYHKIIDKKKLLIIDILNQEYKIKQKNITLIDNIKKHSIQYQDKKGIVFICKDFIDANNKYMYLSCIKNNIDVTLLTDNKTQLQELKENNLPVHELNTEISDKKIAQAKYIIFDQANYTNFHIEETQITIQLWHGVGLKKMSKLDNIIYNYFISTSDWTNETNFKNIFIAKKYLDFGYPRDEFLLRETDKSDLILCDKKLYNISLTNKTILYMPTLREYLFNQTKSPEDIINLDLKKLNKELQKLNYKMIIKLHPYVINFFKALIIKNTLSNILFHPTQGDIYPILKHTDILITDYSSIAYDFLLLDKPIIFFSYDKKLYEKNMDGFLFDYEKYSPGILVKNQQELIKAISQKDTYMAQRDKIKNLFFNTKNIKKSTTLIQKLFDIMA
jgi:CDP-glycerol glycerophosphotransferase (TagB/SpsB family)